MADNQEKVEVFLEAFRPDVNPNSWMEFPCSYCKSHVKATPAIQKQLADGGIGHKCSGCERHYAVVRCGNCHNTIVVDDFEWDRLAVSGIECPTCDVGLFRRTLSGARIVLGGMVLPSLQRWSDNSGEQIFLKEIGHSFTFQNQKMLAVYHRTTGDRIRSAHDSLRQVRDMDIRASMNIMNASGNIEDASESLITATSYELHQHIFRYTNDLRSALDVFSQELAAAFAIKCEENEVDFGSISQLLTKPSHETSKKIETFRKSDEFKYLNKLRNVLQHRRLPLMQELAMYDLADIEAIRQVSVGAAVVLYLPNDPYENPVESNYSLDKPMLDTFGQLYKIVEDFIFETYAIASNELR